MALAQYNRQRDTLRSLYNTYRIARTIYNSPYSRGASDFIYNTYKRYKEQGYTEDQARDHAKEDVSAYAKSTSINRNPSYPANPMPRNMGYKKRRYYPRRRLYRKQPAKVQKQFLASGIGFPRMMKITHKYTAQFNLTTAAGAMNAYNYIANAMTDIDPTAAGDQQPMNYDQMVAIYRHYVVIGSKIKVIMMPTAGSVHLWGVYVNDDTTSPTSARAMQQQPGTQWRLSNNSAVPKENMIIAKWSAKKTFGGGLLANNSLQGTNGANPAEQSYFTIFYQEQTPPNGVAGGATFFVEIEYIAIWKERIEQPLSG